MAYPTLTEVKAYLGVVTGDDDDYLQATLDAVIGSVEQYCQRKFPLEVVVDEHEYNMEGDYSYFVTRYPLVDVTAMSLGDTVFDVVEDLRLNLVTGEVLVTVPLAGDLTISYSGGFDPVPPAVVFVINESVKSAYEGKDASAADGPMKSERVDGVATMQYYSPEDYMGGEGNAPRLIAKYSNMLDTYRSERAFVGM